MSQTLRFLHTADWHLGKKLDRFSRLEEQERVLKHLVRLAEEHQVQAVLVAGDVFDSRNPSPEAKRLFTEGLLQLSKGGERPVLVIAGNHDSAELLDALATWGAPLGILLVGDPFQPRHQFEGSFGAGFELRVIADGLIKLSSSKWPFGCQFLLAPYLPPYRREGEETASAFWKKRWDDALKKATSDLPCILLAHPYVDYTVSSGQGGSAGSSRLEEDLEERPLALGGQEAISMEAFPEGLAYAALGHIHSPAILRERPYPIAYAGSLLQYSFGDTCFEKKALLVEVPRCGPAQVSRLPEKGGLQGGLALRSISVGSEDEAKQYCTQYAGDYLQLIWRGSQAPPLDLRQRLEAQAPRLVYFRLERLSFSGEAPDAELLAQSDDLDLKQLFEAFYRVHKGTAPSQEILDIFEEVLQKAKEKDSSNIQ